MLESLVSELHRSSVALGDPTHDSMPEFLAAEELDTLPRPKLQPHAGIIIHGKGRKERSLPLWKETASALRAWLAVRGSVLAPEVFVNAHGEAMTRSGFEYILRKHVETATKRCT